MRKMKQNYDSLERIFVSRYAEIDSENAADLVVQIANFTSQNMVPSDVEVTYEHGSILLEGISLETDVEFEYRQRANREAYERQNKAKIAQEKKERALYLKLKKKFENNES